MAMEITGVVCPQCGSTDVAMVSDLRGVCRACGSQFVLTPPAAAGGDDGEDAEEVSFFRIMPKYGKDEFLRRLWCRMEELDAPIGVFDADFGEVSATERRVLMSRVEADLSYRASIGYDREEPYTDYETYYDSEPYTDYETYYENGVRRQRAVTKTRQVERQRPVTKYRTVTDWKPMSGQHHASSIAVADDTPEKDDLSDFDEDLFTETFLKTSVSEMEYLTSAEAEAIGVSDEAQSEVNRENVRGLMRDTKDSLPGDRCEDFDSSIGEVTEASDTLYLVTEYEASIRFGGETYSAHAFAFGDMPIAGDEIGNVFSLQDVLAQKRRDSGALCARKQTETEKIIRKKTLPATVLLFSLLAASAGASLFLPYLALIIPAFAAASAAFVWHVVSVRRHTECETNRCEREVREENERLAAELNEYQNNYKKQYRETLNRKLSSLGLKPVN